MKNASKKSWPVLFKIFLLLALPMQAITGFPELSVQDVVCYPPDVRVTTQTYNSVSFAWDAVLGASGYKVRYYRQEDHYTSSETTTGNTYITYSNLPAGTYVFYFSTVCGGESSQEIIVDDLIMG